jgi:hypothetical protein
MANQSPRLAGRSTVTQQISFALIGVGSVGAGVFHQSRLTGDVRCYHFYVWRFLSANA